MKNIAVIGTGYVGLVSGTCFSEVGNNVICCDIDKEKINSLLNGQIPIYEPGLEELVRKNVAEDRLFFTTNIPDAIQNSDIIYIAVGTPMSEDGQADLKYVESVAKTIGQNLNGYKVIVNKSTVPVGTGQMVEQMIKKYSGDKYTFDVVSNPEFLKEGSAIKDTFKMERAVIGARTEKASKIIEELHKPFNTKILKMDVESAELSKYAANAFLATKISFINQIARICEKVGADVQNVSKTMGLDSRIGDKFLNAGVGFGGSCFPKDTTALLHIAESVGCDFNLIDAVIETNRSQPEILINKINQVFSDLKDKTFSILGLAFKPNTNDMRYAPSLTIIPTLQRLGATIKAYDPIAIDEAKKLLGNTVKYYTTIEETIENADACIILTEWEDIVNMDLDHVSEKMNYPIIIDGRNCFDLELMESKGYIYLSIGRQNVNLK